MMVRVTAQRLHRHHWYDVIFLAALTGAFFAMLWFMIHSTSFMLFGTIITHVDTDEKVVALTFDDGPQPGATEEVLGALRRGDVKATFFVIGREAEKHLPQLKRIIADGHEVGNHSYTHPYMTFLSLDRIDNEIGRTDALIRRAGYIGPIPFRVPNNVKFVTLPYYLMQHKRADISRDVRPLEGPKVSPKSIAHEVVSRVHPGSIILLHTMYGHLGSSRRALPLIISGLHAKGYQFVTVSELLTYQKI